MSPTKKQRKLVEHSKQKIKTPEFKEEVKPDLNLKEN
jgi:hypothetical protein